MEEKNMIEQMTREEEHEWREILKQLTHEQKVYIQAFAEELRSEKN